MTVLNGSAEREPLLERSTSPSLSDSEGKDGEAVISTLRGSLIVGSVGLLIFLQGMSSYLFGLSSACICHFDYVLFHPSVRMIVHHDNLGEAM